MKRRQTPITALSLSILATPILAFAEDAPGVFKIPGTDSMIKFYGYAALDVFYDNENKLGDWGTIVDAIHLANGAGNTDGFAPKKAWSMTANRTRFGVMTTTPTSQGDVTAKFEGDFLPGQFRLRHGYGEMAFGESGSSLLFGKTWSTFLDLDAAPETVDFTGGVGSSNFDTARFAMVRYTAKLSKQMTVAVAIEQDQTGSTDSPHPASLAGAFTVDSDIERIENAFLNTFFTLRKNVELGVEYAYGKATAFGNALSKADGTATDTIKESRVQMALQVNFF